MKMRKMLVVLLAMVLLSCFGCGAGLVVNVNSVLENYNKTFTKIEPVMSVKAIYYSSESSYSNMRKRMVWGGGIPSYVSGALFVMDDKMIVATQHQDGTVSVAFVIPNKDVIDVLVDKYSNVCGLVISTSDKTYVVEIAKGVLVDKAKTYEIYNFLLTKTQNKNNRGPLDWQKEKQEEEVIQKEQEERLKRKY